MATRACLDLFCGLGGFSAAFEDSDRWDVITVDVEERFDPDLCADVMGLRPSDLLDVIEDYNHLVVLAGVPCTVYTPARNMTEGGDPAWDGDEPNTPEARDLVALTHHTIGLIEGLSPDYWFVENPIGRIKTVLGQPDAIVTQCQYGRETQKPTYLYGDHPPMTYRRCPAGGDCHTSASYEPDEPQPRLGTLAESGKSEDRAKLPYELSESIREACDDALDGNALEQLTVEDLA